MTMMPHTAHSIALAHQKCVDFNKLNHKKRINNMILTIIALCLLMPIAFAIVPMALGAIIGILIAPFGIIYEIFIGHKLD